MKSKVLVIVLVLIIVALLIILGIKLFEKPKEILIREEEPTEVQPMTQEIWIPADQEGKKIVSKHIGDISADLAAMSGPLTQDLINDHIKPFFVRTGPGPDGPVRHARRFAVTHDGNLKMGGEFVGYLISHLHGPDPEDIINEIKFELAWFVSEEYTTGPTELGKFHHFVHFSLKVSYTMANGDHIDPPGGGGDYHIRDCDWIDP